MHECGVVDAVLPYATCLFSITLRTQVVSIHCQHVKTERCANTSHDVDDDDDEDSDYENQQHQQQHRNRDHNQILHHQSPWRCVAFFMMPNRHVDAGSHIYR